ncbi:interleukin 15, like isoform X1 [Labrus bergylta]|uniref:interleukin 15, like isoform X1 n=1 Tax=Labrus bergylta TaxID=56723 RepID=UPI0009B3E812|nr:interleukin-15-like isoform X1 [Labrus bergylta]XP_020513998.1 interleukin-15-like isoform X1 [Labrus bergylta]
MLTGRRGVACMYLCFFCLLALTHQATDNVFRDIVRRVQRFIKNVPSELLICSLYTPDIYDYQKCPKTTMKCFAKEVKVLIQEWKTVGAAGVPKLDEKLEDLASELDQTNSECAQCELLNEKNATEFLKSLETTLQMMNNELAN